MAEPGLLKHEKRPRAKLRQVPFHRRLPRGTIDLDLGAGYIYWTDRADNTVSRAPIEIPAGFTAATRTDRQILVPNVAVAIGVALDLARGKVYYTSGSNGHGGRANLDGSGNEMLIPMAGNLTGIALGQLP